MSGFKSEAQRQKFAQLLKEGKITQEQYDSRAANSPAKLPPRNASYNPQVRKPKYIKGPK